jgi:hypothetical protein
VAVYRGRSISTLGDDVALRVNKTLLAIGLVLMGIAYLASVLFLTGKVVSGHWLDAGSAARLRIGWTFGSIFVALVFFLVGLVVAIVVRGLWLRRKKLDD